RFVRGVSITGQNDCSSNSRRGPANAVFLQAAGSRMFRILWATSFKITSSRQLRKLVALIFLIVPGVSLVLFLLARASRRFFQSTDLSAVDPKTAVVSAGHS